RVISEITARGHLPLVVGGTGLYIRILTGGLAPGHGPDPDRRRFYRETLDRHGPSYLHELLRKRDSGRAAQIEPADTFRVIRALELLDSGIDSIRDTLDTHGFGNQPYDACKIVLTMDRTRLYNRIDRRVEEMVHRGLADEVRHLAAVYGADAPALDAIGYRQMIQYLDGRLALQDAVRIIQRDSRRYAKRQMTWFRKEPGVEWIPHDPDRAQETLRNIEQRVRRFYEDWYRGTATH
nr:tRNA (adenosine(37)-N6)-dimethylallyltransferase MiaA [bacterium]